MCCKAVRMGMISSRQAVLSRTSRTGVESRRSWGSKAMRMGADLEEILARELAIGCPEGILTRGPHSSGVFLSKTPRKMGSNTFCGGHSLTPSSLAFATAASTIFCASSEEMLSFFTTLAIGHLPHLICIACRQSFFTLGAALLFHLPRRDRTQRAP